MIWFLLGVIVGVLGLVAWFILVTEGAQAKREAELRRADRELFRVTLEAFRGMTEEAHRKRLL